MRSMSTAAKVRFARVVRLADRAAECLLVESDEIAQQVSRLRVMVVQAPMWMRSPSFTGTGA